MKSYPQDQVVSMLHSLMPVAMQDSFVSDLRRCRVDDQDRFLLSGLIEFDERLKGYGYSPLGEAVKERIEQARAELKALMDAMEDDE